MKTSVFDLFKVGIGPSSSHTVGPMRAARQFVADLERAGLLAKAQRIVTELFGSLALTGIGHATDRAILLGLSGEKPETVDPAAIESIVSGIRAEESINVLAKVRVRFLETRDLLFLNNETLPGHPNAMRFTAFDEVGSVLESAIFYSVGGGFIERADNATHESAALPALPVPNPFSSAAELLAVANGRALPIWRIILENECSLRPEHEVRQRLVDIWAVMNDCIERGLATEGILPGGLKVRRRAPRLLARLKARQNEIDPLAAMDWVNAFAMAVNEENAAGGRVVTAPTNGAAGLVPAVGRYYRQFIPDASDEGLLQYLLTPGPSASYIRRTRPFPAPK
jgi:L-serine dehydratase